MKQSKKMSFIEAIANAIISYTIAIGTQLVCFPLFDIHVPLEHNFYIGFIFFFVSIIRSYVLRRVFNLVWS